MSLFLQNNGLINVFVDFFFQDSLNGKFKRTFKIEIFCNNGNLFTDQCNAFLQNRSISFFENKETTTKK